MLQCDLVKKVLLTADPLAPGIPSVPGFPCTQDETQQVNSLSLLPSSFSLYARPKYLT